MKVSVLFAALAVSAAMAVPATGQMTTPTKPHVEVGIAGVIQDKTQKRAAVKKKPRYHASARPRQYRAGVYYRGVPRGCDVWWYRNMGICL